MSHLHLVRCWRLAAPTPALAERPSGPLVGDLRPCGPSPRIRGSLAIVRGGPVDPADAMTASRFGGDGGESSYGWLWDPVVVPDAPGVGGDEETRTPDPLLAKEMLFRLSYVPSRVRAGLTIWGVGAGWWAFLDSNQRPLPYQGSALTS